MIAYVIIKLNAEQKQLDGILSLLLPFSSLKITLLMIILILVPVNWLFEAAKWKLLINDIQEVSLWKAFKGVLSGVSASMLAPQFIGDFVGRMGQIDASNRSQSFGPLMMGKLAQFAVMLGAGTFGVFTLAHALENPPYLVIFGLVTAISFILSVCFTLFPQGFAGIMRWRVLKRFRTYFEVITDFRPTQMLLLLFYSSARYVTFAFQFYLALKVFEIPLPDATIVAGVCWVLLAKTIVPTLNFFSDLGVREFSAILFFDAFAIDPWPVLMASLAIWIINILFPAAVGSFFTFGAKFQTQ